MRRGILVHVLVSVNGHWGDWLIQNASIITIFRLYLFIEENNITDFEAVN